jgi:hypothetical protein
VTCRLCPNEGPLDPETGMCFECTDKLTERGWFGLALGLAAKTTKDLQERAK